MANWPQNAGEQLKGISILTVLRKQSGVKIIHGHSIKKIDQRCYNG
jgi:hypothetical protein